MRLNVYIGDQQVGGLDHESHSDLFRFEYAANWKASPQGFPLGPTLPLDPVATDSVEVHSQKVRIFFSNLLPEGRHLDELAAAYRVHYLRRSPQPPS